MYRMWNAEIAGVRSSPSRAVDVGDADASFTEPHAREDERAPRGRGNNFVCVRALDVASDVARAVTMVAAVETRAVDADDGGARVRARGRARVRGRARSRASTA